MLVNIQFYKYPEYTPKENNCVLVCKNNNFFDIGYRNGTKFFSATDKEEITVLYWADTECEDLVNVLNLQLAI